jgi:hypothetical protein
VIPHRLVVGAFAALGLVACSASAAGPTTAAGSSAAVTGATASGSTGSVAGTGGTAVGDGSGTSGPPLTVGGVGVLPGPLPTESPQEVGSTTTAAPFDKTVGALAAGNRVLMLGDSILASTTARYTNDMCDALVPLGWQLEIDAEVSRPVNFGQQVLAARLDAGWDAGLVLLGNNYNNDENDFFARYDDILTRFGEKPVVALTVTEFDPVQTRVNAMIRALAAAHPNVILVDWATISTYGGVRGGDGLHLTDLGRKVLADTVAPVFGTAPAQPGKCLDSKYTDDSAGSVTGGPSTGVNKTTTTVRGGAVSTTAGGGGSGRTTSTTRVETGTTVAHTTPDTSSPKTEPGTTSPPKTEPSTTKAPATTKPPPTTIPGP